MEALRSRTQRYASAAGTPGRRGTWAPLAGLRFIKSQPCNRAGETRRTERLGERWKHGHRAKPVSRHRPTRPVTLQ
jgi:hypothetical protein